VIRYVGYPKFPGGQQGPDPVVVRTIEGEKSRLEFSIDPERKLVGGEAFVQKGPRTVGDEKTRDLLSREEAMLELLGNNHKNLIKCHGHWRNPDGEERLLLEYIPGEDLKAKLENYPGQQLAIEEIRHILRGVCQALLHMHELGIVHRNIKPAKLMIRSDDGTVVLLGFGAALPFAETGNKERSEGCETYASPEQLNKLELDGRSDIFSLGIILVEMLTGKHPFFVENNLEQTLDNNRNSRMLPEVRNELPQEYQGVVERMLAVDPADRYNNCEEILYDLMSLSL